MPSYRYWELHKEFIAFFKTSQEKNMHTAWQWVQKKGIVHEAANGLPSRQTVFNWARLLSKKR